MIIGSFSGYKRLIFLFVCKLRRFIDSNI